MPAALAPRPALAPLLLDASSATSSAAAAAAVMRRRDRRVGIWRVGLVLGACGRGVVWERVGARGGLLF